MKHMIIKKGESGFLKDHDLQTVANALVRRGVLTEYIGQTPSGGTVTSIPKSVDELKALAYGLNKRSAKRRSTKIGNRSASALKPCVADDGEYDKEMLDLIVSSYSLWSVKDLTEKYNLKSEAVRKNLYRNNALGISMAGQRGRLYPSFQFTDNLLKIDYNKDMAAAINALRKCELTDVEILYWLASPIRVDADHDFADVDDAVNDGQFDSALQILADKEVSAPKKVVPLDLIKKRDVASFYQVLEQELGRDFTKESRERGIEDVTLALEVLVKYNISAELTGGE